MLALSAAKEQGSTLAATKENGTTKDLFASNKDLFASTGNVLTRAASTGYDPLQASQASTTLPQRTTSLGEFRSKPGLLRRKDSLPSILASPQTEEEGGVAASQRWASLHPGSKIFIRTDSQLYMTNRPKRGGFSASAGAVHPVLASRYRWRAAAADCVTNNDESRICELVAATTPCAASSSPTAASSPGVSASPSRASRHETLLAGVRAVHQHDSLLAGALVLAAPVLAARFREVRRGETADNLATHHESPLPSLAATSNNAALQPPPPHTLQTLALARTRSDTPEACRRRGSGRRGSVIAVRPPSPQHPPSGLAYSWRASGRFGAARLAATSATPDASRASIQAALSRPLPRGERQGREKRLPSLSNSRRLSRLPSS